MKICFCKLLITYTQQLELEWAHNKKKEREKNEKFCHAQTKKLKAFYWTIFVTFFSLSLTFHALCISLPIATLTISPTTHIKMLFTNRFRCWKVPFWNFWCDFRDEREKNLPSANFPNEKLFFSFSLFLWLFFIHEISFYAFKNNQKKIFFVAQTYII